MGKAFNIIYNESVKFKPIATRKYVGTKLLDVLATAYPDTVGQYNTGNRMGIFRRGSIAGYNKYYDSIYNLGDVLDILRMEEVSPKRIHFILNGTHSESLCSALSDLLSPDTPFDTSIYTGPEEFSTQASIGEVDNTPINNKYSYTIYSGLGERKKNIPTKGIQKTYGV